jgi:hypothetical protein
MNSNVEALVDAAERRVLRAFWKKRLRQIEEKVALEEELERELAAIRRRHGLTVIDGVCMNGSEPEGAGYDEHKA